MDTSVKNLRVSRRHSAKVGPRFEPPARPGLGSRAIRGATHLANIIGGLTRVARSVLPTPRGESPDRWRRGREQARRLARCDAVVVSYGKSGRTWLRVMLSYYLQRAHDLPEGELLSLNNYQRCNGAAPSIDFTHDNYLLHYTDQPNDRRDHDDKRVVLMVRQPQDVAISQYHHWRHRRRSDLKRMDNYPADGSELSLFEFVCQPRGGLPRIIEWMNEWAAETPHVRDLHGVRPEDLKRSPTDEFFAVADFLLGSADPALAGESVQFGDVGSMRKLEQTGFFGVRGRNPMRARDPATPDSAKVRQARAGGYREDFGDAPQRELDTYVGENLDPVFGYSTC